MSALGVVRYVLPQLLVQLSRAVEEAGPQAVAERIMADCAPSLGNADLHALANVLPALACECRNQLAGRVATAAAPTAAPTR